MALLVSEGVNADDVLHILQHLKTAGVHTKLLAAHMGQVSADNGSQLPIDATFNGLPSLTFDAVIVPDSNMDALLKSGDARYFLLEAYKHLKVIGLSGKRVALKRSLTWMRISRKTASWKPTMLKSR